MPESTETEHVLSRRLNKILETRLENDPDTIEALKQLSTFYTENTLQNRRCLRSQIEKRSLIINENFLLAFKEVKESFDAVYNDITDMSKDLQDMTKRLQAAKVQTRHLLEQTSALQNESKTTDTKIEIANAFIETFQLNQDDLTALYGSNPKIPSPVMGDIFSALEKVHTIHMNCKILMQSGHQVLASNLMEQMTMHQERAIERLYRWAQYNCRNVESPEYTETLTKAMEILQTRGLLFKYVIEEYAMFRRGVVESEFINALTRGGPSGNPAPIEMRAHDPQIYVTDMLAWLNKAIPVEKQKMNLLLSKCTKLEECQQHLETAFSSIFEGACLPLKNRIEKILTVPSEPHTLYAVTNLLRYYKKTMVKVVVNGSLAELLPQMESRAEAAFLNCLKEQVGSMLVRVEAPPRDLSPTASINNLLVLLRDILSTASMSEGRESDMTKIAAIVMDPLLRAVNEQASRLPPIDMAVYMLNCMYAMYTCLSLYQYMETRLERLQAQSEAQIDTLTSEQASSLVANLNLGPIYTILQDTAHGALSSIPGMEPSNLRNFLHKLDTLIIKPETLLLPQINLLASSQHKRSVQKRAFDVLIAIYKQLYEAVMNPSNLYETPGNILNKTPAEMQGMMDNLK